MSDTENPVENTTDKREEDAQVTAEDPALGQVEESNQDENVASQPQETTNAETEQSAVVEPAADAEDTPAVEQVDEAQGDKQEDETIDPPEEAQGAQEETDQAADADQEAEADKDATEEQIDNVDEDTKHDDQEVQEAQGEAGEDTVQSGVGENENNNANPDEEQEPAQEAEDPEVQTARAEDGEADVPMKEVEGSGDPVPEGEGNEPVQEEQEDNELAQEGEEGNEPVKEVEDNEPAQEGEEGNEPEKDGEDEGQNAENGNEPVQESEGLGVPETDNKGQQTTPKTTPAPSRGAPTPHSGDTPAQEPETITEGPQESQAEDAAQLEDKKTPEPPTEDMGTGTEPQRQESHDHQAAMDHVDPQAPSPMLQFDKDATATVKFVLLPTQQVATLRCYLTQTLYDLKQHFAQELKIPASTILLMLDGKGTGDRMTLGELGVGPNGTIRLEMQSADPENQPITAFKPRQEYTMPDVISVRVQSDVGMKDVVVEIERSLRKKPFLGGYRHKNTGIEYHHASAQTMQKPRPPPAVDRFCRDTQTVKQKHTVQQTTNSMATQMTKIGVYVSNIPDKLVVPGKYTTADDYKINMLNQVIIIQKYYRRWLSKRYVEKVREDQLKREEWEREEELRKKKEKEDRIRKEFERRMNPKSKEDFDLLYHALEKWRQEEMNNINQNLTGAERKAALCQLLDQETQLIASIGRHKLEADSENKQKQIQSFLDRAAAPKKWRGPDGKQTEMDTPYTIRALELKDIYNSINMKYLTQDERLDVLLTLKHTVKEHDCKLTQEIIELIDREADLLMRGVKDSNLEGLRKRISTLFLQYIKTPTFNPEAARLLKVPQDPSTLRKNIYFCPSCNQYLPSTEFQLSSNSRAVGKCRKCAKIDNDARVRQDYSHYRFMLKGVRKSEETYEDESKIAFLMQENDLRYLVENIWNSQSVLSAWDDLYDLVLVRWDNHEEWSPWNSILLTKEEATAHEKLGNLEEAYGKVFVHKVKHKHTLARNYFSRMPGMAEHMRTRNGSALPNGPAVSGKALSITPTRA